MLANPVIIYMYIVEMEVTAVAQVQSYSLTTSVSASRLDTTCEASHVNADKQYFFLDLFYNQ